MTDERCHPPTRRTAAGLFTKRDGQLGAGTIEFALIVPFLLMIIVAIIEMSNVYFMRNQLSEITRDATRRFAVGALEEKEVEAFVLKRLSEQTNVAGEVEVAEEEIDGVIDVTLSLSVPFTDVLLFDNLIDKLWSGAPPNISVTSTMIKH